MMFCITGITNVFGEGIPVHEDVEIKSQLKVKSRRNVFLCAKGQNWRQADILKDYEVVSNL